MYPKISLIGRPNVGKSTLFNRLIHSNRAITHDRPGVTRDRMEGIVRRDGRTYTVVDTGGITLDEHHAVMQGPEELQGFEQEILRQAEEAINESVAICLVVDGIAGLLPFDEALASYVRKRNIPVLLVVNKVDGAKHEDAHTADFHALGFPIVAISGEHGHNIRYFEERVAELLPSDEEWEIQEKEKGLKLALLGRPNAGKSSIINAIMGEDRQIVSDIAGTTRDSVDLTYETAAKRYTFVDTAGVRRRSKITDTVERYSVNSSIKSSTKANVTLLVINADEGLTQQDKRLINLLAERNTPFLLIVNKMDLVDQSKIPEIKKLYKDALGFCGHVPIVYTSAMTRMNLKKILPLAEQIWEECHTRIPTGLLNRAMEEVLTRHQPPVVKRVRPKFFYLTQAETNPPTFVFFVNDHERVKESYARYLEKSLRKIFKIAHAPMRLRLRSAHQKRTKKK